MNAAVANNAHLTALVSVVVVRVLWTTNKGGILMSPNRVVFGVAVLFAALLIADLQSKPDRKTDVPKKPPIIPDLSSETNWGRLVQVGRKVSISGNDVWDAEGEIRADGKTMFLLWTLKSNGRPAPSVYQLDGDLKAIKGLWAYGDECVIDDKGQIDGEHLRHDTIWKIEPKID